MNRKSRFSMLWVVAIISLSVLGCGTTTFMGERYSEHSYITPILPKSELATIQIDTQGQWFQRYVHFGMSINKKQVFHEIFMDDNNLSIDDVFVRPGKQDISLLLLTQYDSEYNRGEKHQTVAYYSIDVKAGGTYLLKGELGDDCEDEVNFKLIDTDTDQVVSKYNTSRKTTYKIEDSLNQQSSEIGWSFSF